MSKKKNDFSTEWRSEMTFKNYLIIVIGQNDLEKQQAIGFINQKFPDSEIVWVHAPIGNNFNITINGIFDAIQKSEREFLVIVSDYERDSSIIHDGINQFQRDYGKLQKIILQKRAGTQFFVWRKNAEFPTGIVIAKRQEYFDVMGQKTNRRKKMFNKALVLGVGLFSAIVSIAATPTITDVTAKQRFPWNGLVDITYTVSGDVESLTKPIVVMTAKDESSGLTYLASTFTVSPKTTVGTHTATWNTKADGLYITSDKMRMTVSIEDNFQLYCLINVSGGSSATKYPVSYLSEIPKGGWTSDHKKNYIVLRWCPAGTYMMQGQRKVTLTKPFYIGIFEVTNDQYAKVMGGTSSGSGPAWVGYNDIRGGTDYPNSTAVGVNSFVGKIMSKSGLKNIDLPTEAQWEYACRAGTVTELNTGKGLNPVNVKEVARVYAGSNAGRMGEVGCFRPNFWGLYDMHGNAEEVCLDWHKDDVGTVDAIDPIGETSGSSRVTRGCGWSYPSDGCSYLPDGVSCYSSCARGFTRSGDKWSAGFRICMTLK